MNSMYSAPAEFKRENIFSSQISICSYRDFIQNIFWLATNKKSSYVCFANVHMIIEAHKDKSFSDVVNNAALVAPDGKPLSVYLKFTKGINQDRICGMDILPDLLKEATLQNKSVYFFGNTVEVLEKISARIAIDFPSLNVVGYHSPPFRPLSSFEKEEIINMINTAKPDLLLVSLGCPKQENWMAEHHGKIKGCMLGLGQAFNTYAGTEKRLPRWMQQLSLEWVYRLCMEPRRLWKRYAYTNSMFIFLAGKSLLTQWLQKPKKIFDISFRFRH